MKTVADSTQGLMFCLREYMKEDCTVEGEFYPSRFSTIELTDMAWEYGFLKKYPKKERRKKLYRAVHRALSVMQERGETSYLPRSEWLYRGEKGNECARRPTRRRRRGLECDERAGRVL